MDHPRPNMRYVDAKELDDKANQLRGLEVNSSNGEKLGKVEGFIIDNNSGRPYHVVVGSGGWFRHKHFLLPIGHVALAPSQDRLVADVTKDRVERFPGHGHNLSHARRQRNRRPCRRRAHEPHSGLRRLPGDARRRGAACLAGSLARAVMSVTPRR